MSDRPFRILGIQQVAIGALDKGPLRELWVDVLGLEPAGTAGHGPGRRTCSSASGGSCTSTASSCRDGACRNQ